jgi:uncharacterized protein DUF3499
LWLPLPAVSEHATARTVVHPITSGGGRGCARPGCPAPASATMTFAYHPRTIRIGPLAAEAIPEAYDLCAPHADRSTPPRGWTLDDGRPTHPSVVGDAPRGHDATVAVLAAALRQARPAATPPPPRPARERAPARIAAAAAVVTWDEPAQLW